MRFLKVIGFIVLFCFLISPLHAQRILLVEKSGKFKNFKYFVGDDISLRLKAGNEKHRGTIHEITDSSILINFDNEILLSEIGMILKPRWGWSLLSNVTRIAGLGYMALDIVNNTINNSAPIVDESTLLIGAGMVAFSYAILPLHNRQLKKGKKWRIKVLNFSLDDEPPNPFQQEKP